MKDPDSERFFDALHFRRFSVVPGCPACGKTLDELGLKNQPGIQEIGFRRNNVPVNDPPGTTILVAGDTIVVFATDQNIPGLESLFKDQ